MLGDFAPIFTPLSEEQELVLFESSLSLGISLLTIALGWLVGQRLTVRWNLHQKQRELDLTTAHEFHTLYGEFFAIWKLWNYSLKAQRGCTVTRSDLLVRACAAEGAVESLFVRLAASRDLRDEDIKTLGRFRQGYQTLRETIRGNKELKWDISTHPEYLAFKQLATAVALLIFSEQPPADTITQKRAGALVSITANRREGSWARP
jgi:hypothetical protein